jgi:hypothetical protein
MPEQWERNIPCRDRMGRNRLCQVVITAAGDVMVVAPPGEVALFYVNELNDVKQAIADAQVELIHRKRGF